MKKKEIKNKNDRESGFTLLETIVAVTVLTMAIVGPMTLTSRSIGSAMVSQNQVTAFYLAQEAMEYIRYRRDNNILNGDNWLSGLDDCDIANGPGCYIDVDPLGNNTSPTSGDYIAMCDAAAGCPKLNTAAAGSGEIYYTYQTGNETPFIRKTTLELADTYVDAGGNTANIGYILKTEVDWQEKGQNKTLSLQENIFNW